MQMVSEGRLPHALMLCGPQGSGKLALAIGFATHLLSRTANDEAMLRKLEHPDLHFTYPTIKLPSMGADHKPVSEDFAKEWHELIMAGPYFTMNEWLEQMGGENQQAIITAGESDSLVRKLSLKSSQGGYKVSIIWLPERMNIECANKILKLLEEPPSQTVFILVCQDPDRLLETIRSRVQRIDIKKIADEDIFQALTEQRGLTEDMAHRVTRMANGSWLKALQLLSSNNPQIEKVRNAFHPEHNGDIMIEVSPGWRILNESTQENHLSRASYTQFPIIFFGAGISAEKVKTAVTTDRIAPTISKAIRIRAPNACSAEPLF